MHSCRCNHSIGRCFLESLLIALNIKRIIRVPFAALLSEVNLKEKEEKEEQFRKPSQEFEGLDMVMGDGLVQTISE